MANYVFKFISNVADKTQLLRELLQKDRQFMWTVNHQREFDKLKNEIVSPKVLAKFDVNKKSRVSADASSFGIGAVLEQLQEDDNWKPVYFCSKSLSPTERGYAQIEKEALAITWACERLEQYLLGAKFIVQTDHKPLTVILKTREVNKLTNRLQRFRMRLLKFNFDICYVPEGVNDEDIATQDVFIDAVRHEVDTTICSEDRIRASQKEDEAISQIMKYITTSWPSKEKRSSRTSPYWKQEAGTLFYKDRIVIPEDLRKWCLDLLHDGHFGISRCMSRAKETIWWPGITRHIEDTVNSCEICIKHRQPVTEPMLSSEIPTRPWQVIGADLAEHENKKYLVIQDYYSKYPEIRKLKKTTSNDIIEVFKEIFARHENLQKCTASNGPAAVPNIHKATGKQKVQSNFLRKYSRRTTIHI
ncbi:hypothetical protein GEV33_005847 [Tenebrio molitor]|uniref:RNA-directed DNA polymerase n=1 Tax=Tenebrio molitor TaxID=7067 RepID=A0A8J6HLN2_TENMO|nr:hypothetical protein GEV33_005847 [Tenebrio molitor]